MAAFTLINASVIPHATHGIIEGPGSRTTLVGPDGSLISSLQPGGKVIADVHATVLEHAVPLAAYSVPAAPIITQEHIIEPVLETKSAVVAPHLLVSHVPSVKLAPVFRAEKHIDLNAAPVVAAVGAKTAISEQSSSIIHPSSARAIHAEPILATPVLAAPALPLVTANVAPVAVADITPIVGTKTTVSEHAETLVSHSSPVLHSHVAPLELAHPAPISLPHSAPIIATHHSAPLLRTHVHPVPLGIHAW